MSTMSEVKVDEKEVISKLFRRECDDNEIQDYNAYFKHFTNQIADVPEGVENPAERAIEAIDKMRTNPKFSKQELCESLKMNSQNSAEQVNQIINCAVRVWLMINCRLPREQKSNLVEICWNDNETLHSFVDRVLGIPSADPGRLDETDEPNVADMRKEASDATGGFTHPLTGENLKRYSNIETVFTPYLDKHLSFNQTYYEVFEHRRWLLDTIAMWDTSSSITSTGTESKTSMDKNARTDKGASMDKDVSTGSQASAHSNASADSNKSKRFVPWKSTGCHANTKPEARKHVLIFLKAFPDPTRSP